MIVLDTHALVWADTDVTKLGRRSRMLIEREWSGGDVAASALSFWEAAVLLTRGRIGLPMAPTQWRAEVLAGGMREIPVDGAIAIRAAGLSGLPGDPIDRLIVATALECRATLVTADEGLLHWPHALDRHDART